MSKILTAKPTKRGGNAVARDLRTPKYRQRVERNRKTYSRKIKHSNQALAF